MDKRQKDLSNYRITEANDSLKVADHCLKEIKVFGDSHIEEISEKFNIPVLGKLPIDPKLTQACDAGLIEDVENIYLDGVMDIIL